jgi:hypothetical protein
MNVTEVLQFADNLVFAKTGEHLDDLKQAILRGVWQRQKYSKVAEEYHCTEGHVKDVASELWKLLSDLLGEELNKSNFRSTMERWQFSNVSYFEKAILQINNVNASADTFNSPNYNYTETGNNETRPTANVKPKLDLAEMPQPGAFYNRTQELITLEQWIAEEHCHLVTIWGIAGIGKTALAVQLVEQIKDKFEYVIWHSIRNSPSLETIQTNLIEFLSYQEETELPTNSNRKRSPLIHHLQKHRCLIILDDVQTILSSGQLAGNIKAGYEDYSAWFRQIAELSHHSCILLLSWEKPREIATLESENKSVRCWQLQGLGAEAEEIFKAKGLVEEPEWLQLINYYQGNPLWLKIITATIQDLFNSKVSDLLQYDPLFISDDIYYVLSQQFNRLSDLEKQVMYILASETDPVPMSKLLERTQLLPADLFNAVQSLGRRSLIEKPAGNLAIFTLQPALKQYVKCHYVRTLA